MGVRRGEKSGDFPEISLSGMSLEPIKDGSNFTRECWN